MSFLATLSPKSRWLFVAVLGTLLFGLFVIVISYSQYLSTKAIGTRTFPAITVTGPKVASITIATPYTLKLTHPLKTKKVEICHLKNQKSICTLLSSSVKGSQLVITLPRTVPTGKATLKITERTGATLGKILLQRTVIVKAAPKPTPATEPETGESGSGSGNSGTENSDPPPTPSTPPTAGAIFLTPTTAEVVSRTTPLDIRVQLTETTTSTLRCQEWLLNGVPISSTQWTNGQAPDLSAEPCT